MQHETKCNGTCFSLSDSRAGRMFQLNIKNIHHWIAQRTWHVLPSK